MNSFPGPRAPPSRPAFSPLERPQLWNQTRGKKTYVHQAKPANPARKSISLSVMGIISESSGDKTVMQRGCWLIRVGPPEWCIKRRPPPTALGRLLVAADPDSTAKCPRGSVSFDRKARPPPGPRAATDHRQARDHEQRHCRSGD